MFDISNNLIQCIHKILYVSRTINFRQNSKKAIEMKWTPLQNEGQSLGEEELPVDTAMYEEKKKKTSKQSWKNKVTDFMRSRNMEDRHLQQLGMDRRLLAIQTIIVIIIIIIIINSMAYGTRRFNAAFTRAL